MFNFLYLKRSRDQLAKNPYVKYINVSIIILMYQSNCRDTSNELGK